jgi:2-C-methyl-D-erythritol 4-phosphate cytidylyltransferase/2-C-methyl-D-erythritol 2,4-cyclodiphosphate synthase
MRATAAILAAGQGTRFGGDKTEERLGAKRVWEWSYQAFATHPAIENVFVVAHESKLEAFRSLGVTTIEGGATRQDSSRNATEFADGADILLIHDAARPFVSHTLIDRVLGGIQEATAAAPALPVSDTVKEMREGRIRTLDRSHLWAMQTPQGAYRDVLLKAHERSTALMTDEMALVEALGVHPMLVQGESNNFKITTPEDLDRARALVGRESRTGMGYDVHAFSDNPDRKLMLGGVEFPGHPGLEGHSDADVLLHAVTDALLGAAGLGDIGQHFPNTEARWKGEASGTFLRAASEMLKESGWSVVNVDATMIAESPKVMPRQDSIRARIAELIGVTPDRIGIKATTNERLGSIGRGEGIAAFAVATISR